MKNRGNSGAEYVFGEMPVRRAVLRQVLPAVAAQLIAIIYGFADTYFVGLLDRPEQTAALTVASSSFLMLTAVSNLFGVGGAGMIARLIARGKRDEAGKVSAAAFSSGIAASLVFSLIYAVFSGGILTLCGAKADTTEAAYGYVFWTVIIGGPFNVAATLCANLVRAEGKSFAASAGLSLGGLLNVLLDPFFVLPEYLDLGATGAGLATAISNAVSAVFFVIFIILGRKNSVLRLKPDSFRAVTSSLKGIIGIGLPSAVQYALTVVAVSAQSAFMAKYSTEAVAAMGIVKKLDTLPLYFSIGVSNGLLPLLAYNFASGDKDRRRRIFRFGTALSAGFAVVCVIIYEIFAPLLAGIFISDAMTVGYAADFLRRMVTAMPLMAVCYPMIIQFQAAGRAKEALIVSVLRKGVIDVPIMFLFDAISPMYGCTLVQPVVDAISLFVAAGIYRSLRRKNEM